jgi:cytochrome c oxidase assembly protein subunit 15
VAALIIAMVVVGGLTRLTGSGLSITEWDPIVGALPPLSDAAWLDAFHKYQQIPQYRLENAGMTLQAFKGIFWWEWAHRFLGRAIGVVFFVPFLWFAVSGQIARKDWPRMLLLFALGALQGFVGWWMVESGIETTTNVSVAPYRLAIHLGVAVLLLGAILWIALEYLRPKNNLPLMGVSSASVRTERAALQMGGYAFVILVYLQLLLGALVAGLHAGLIYNTWPSMDGRAFPEHPFFTSPWGKNFFENPGLAQFDHRIGAYLVALSAFALWWTGRRMGLTGLARRSSNAVLHLTLFQIVLGIATLLLQVPIWLAALHQLTAALLFCAAVWQAFELRKVASP